MANPETTKKSRFLRCEHCARLITRLEWEAFKFSRTYQCCKSMRLLPYADMETENANSR